MAHEELTRLCKQAIEEVTAANMQLFKILPESKVRAGAMANVQDSLRRAVAHHHSTPVDFGDEKLNAMLAANDAANIAQFFILARVSRELADKIAAEIIKTPRN